MASCVFGAGANELAEASIVASTKVRMTTAATMLVTATAAALAAALAASRPPARHGALLAQFQRLNFTRGITLFVPA